MWRSTLGIYEVLFNLGYISSISNYFLAAVFLFTGIDKLFHYKGFIIALSSYVVVPAGSADYLALPIMLSEIWIAVGLLITSWRKMAALIAVGAMGLFTVALVINYIYAPESICGCWFSITLGTATPTHILMNLTLIGLAAAACSDRWSGERDEVNTFQSV